MATVLTIAVTLIAGAAVFSFVNSQATVSENQYGQAVGGTIDSMNERIVVANMNFSQTPCSPCSVTIWLYNAGQLNVQLAQVNLYNPSRSLNIIYTDNPNAATTCTQVKALDHSSGGLESPALNTFNLATGGVQKVTLYLQPSCGQTFSPGVAYTVNVLSTRGNTVLYYQAS